jgi:glycogen phosphorylase
MVGSGRLAYRSPFVRRPGAVPRSTTVQTSALRASLDRLARNLRWTWHRPTRELFVELAGGSWEASGRNPVVVLEQLRADDLDALAADASSVARVQDLVDGLDAELTATDTWFDTTGGDRGRTVAYFSAEFALADCLKTYSGGLGVLAGDHLRSASDLGLPLVAVGLAYRDGYFRQVIDGDGRQLAEVATNDFARLPVEPVVTDDGRRIVVDVEVGDGTVSVQAWRAQVGRVPVYLLDTDVSENFPVHRDITGALYGGDADTRLCQELVLGVGGARLLEALGIRATTFHLNEGHAAFAGLERIRVHQRAGLDLDAAIAAVRDELVFTTHTPVPAGHDVFTWDHASYRLEPLTRQLGVPFERLWELASGHGEHKWNQTTLALRLSGRANGVARLHGRVSREMWASLWPDRPLDDVPIEHVTNGVHPAWWVGPEVASLIEGTIGTQWARTWDPALWDQLRTLDRAHLWQAHREARERLISTVSRRLAAQAARNGVEPDGAGLDPEALTIGFARRFATYKRATLFAHDVDQLAAILGSTDRPVQILVAGKAHPADVQAQGLITELVQLSRDPRLGGRLAVLEGYDLSLAADLVAGCDVWLNTPTRPMEASGTSGMKAAMNGVLNLSVLDGWWDEAVVDLAPLAEVGFGWGIGDGSEHADAAERDAADATSLYRLLADEVVPTFFDRDADGIPQRWVAMMVDAIRVLSPRFSTHRMVADYSDRYGVSAGAGAPV